MFTALLDSCVLWPSIQRDFLLSLAFEGAYRFIFSEAILLEVEVNEEIKRVERGDSQGTAKEKAKHLSAQMRSSFSDSIVTGWEGLEGTYGLPDPDDEHVLAAALVGGAGSIVTYNFRDLPDKLIPAGIQIVSPQEFAFKTAAMRPDLALAAVQAMSLRSGRNHPRLEALEILGALDKLYGLDETTAIIRRLIETE